MEQIFFRDGILIYYGNPAGYLREGKVILDSLFDKADLIRYIKENEQAEIEIRDGIYDRLLEGGEVQETECRTEERRLRIYQLKQDSPIMMRFISLAERRKRGFGDPRSDDYNLVYEEEIDKFDLENVWERFGREIPDDFQGHALSISDVVAFTEGSDSRFFYVEPSGFSEITLENRQ